MANQVKHNRIFLGVFLAFTWFMLSCSNTVDIDAGKFSNSNFKVRKYNGCCGCEAQYFNIYENEKHTQQTIFKYNCYQPGMPTKFVFKYDFDGALLYCEKYIATIEGDFEIPITSEEQQILGRLERTNSLMLQERYISLTSIKGFRKVKVDEISHSFPLIAGGSKIEIR